MKLSIIIPAYNADNYLPALLAKLDAQMEKESPHSVSHAGGEDAESVVGKNVLLKDDVHAAGDERQRGSGVGHADGDGGQRLHDGEGGKVSGAFGGGNQAGLQRGAEVAEHRAEHQQHHDAQKLGPDALALEENARARQQDGKTGREHKQRLRDGEVKDGDDVSGSGKNGLELALEKDDDDKYQESEHVQRNGCKGNELG